MPNKPRASGEAGETLLELLVSITILGVAVIAIASGLAGTVMVSSLHRQQSDAQRALRNYAESLESGSYNPCTSTSAASYSLGSTAGFVAPTVTVTYWNNSTPGFQPSCPSGGDTGLQKVKISLQSADGRVADSVAVVLRSSA